MKKVTRNAIIIIMTILITSNIIVMRTNRATADAQDVKIPILLYHNIVYNYDDAIVNITPDQFYLHMLAIKNHGFNTITLQDYYDFVNSGKDLPQNPILITFDDGYISNYEYGYKMLKELNMKATIFVITSTMGKTEGVSYPHFTWEQAKEMQDSGVIDIQSHSHSHIDLSILDQETLDYELKLSKHLIEKTLNKNCDFIAFPFGYNSDYTIAMAKKAGYTVLLEVGNTGYANIKNAAHPLKRLTIWGSRTENELINQINTNLQNLQLNENIEHAKAGF